MTSRARLGLFAVAVVGLVVLAVPAFATLPAFGHIDIPLADVLVRIAIEERHTANTVTAILFDIRSMDTLGEEAILFSSVAGTALLLRTLRREREEPPEQEARAPGVAGRSPAIRRVGVVFVGLATLVGLAMLAHGHLTPGGGFQGGVMLAGAVLLIHLLHDYAGFDAIADPARTEPVEGLAIAGLISVGAVGLSAGLPFLFNVLPFGTLGALPSGGTIPLLNTLSGVAVASAIAMILAEFAEQTVRVRGGGS